MVRRSSHISLWFSIRGRPRRFHRRSRRDLRRVHAGWVARIGLSLTLILGWVAAAVAQSTSSPSSDGGETLLEAEARAAFQRGVRFAKEERYRDAHAAFERAWSLVQRPNLALNLAAMRYRLGRYVKARQALSDYERLAVPEDGHRQEAQALAQSIAAAMASLTMRIEPAAARVWVDGQERLGQTAVRKLELDPGSHRLRLELAGHASLELEVHLEPGQAAWRELRLEPQANAPVLRVPSASAEGERPLAEPPWSTLRWSGVGVSIAGAAGLAACAAFGVAAIVRNSASSEDCDGNACGTEGFADRMAARRWGNAATAAGVVGVSLLGVGAALFLWGAEASTDPESRDQPRLSPQLSGDRIGMTMTGRW